MNWQVCIRYPNGQEKAICSFQNRENALKRIDAIYSQGYPMHVAYVVRPAQYLEVALCPKDTHSQLQPA